MPSKPRKTAGLIGLGIIGSRAAAGLRAAGFQTYVWNRTPQPAPNFLATPGDIAAAADLIQIFVADGAALFEVLSALRERLTSQHIIISSATIGPEATLEAAKFVQETGARFLDAPFTGSKVAAERRQLVYYIGGDEAVFLRAKPMLEATSKAIVRIGDIGDASIVKVATNMISAASVQVLSEVLALVRKAGLSDEALAAAIEHNACRSGVLDLKLPKMASGDYEPHFSLKHMLKDVQLGLQMANTLEVDCPIASVTAGSMFSGVKQGWGDLDFASVFKAYEHLFARHPRALAGAHGEMPALAGGHDPGLAEDDEEGEIADFPASTVAGGGAPKPGDDFAPLPGAGEAVGHNAPNAEAKSSASAGGSDQAGGEKAPEGKTNLSGEATPPADPATH